jgi:methionine synthase II (cobalamin-independent)
MTDKTILKTYLISIGATCDVTDVVFARLLPGLILVEREEGKFIGVAHIPQMLVQFEEETAREDAFRKALEFFPPEEGWRDHNCFLSETPRQVFISMGLFITAREVWYRLLRMTGFRPIT